MRVGGNRATGPLVFISHKSWQDDNVGHDAAHATTTRTEWGRVGTPPPRQNVACRARKARALVNRESERERGRERDHVRAGMVVSVAAVVRLDDNVGHGAAHATTRTGLGRVATHHPDRTWRVVQGKRARW